MRWHRWLICAVAAVAFLLALWLAVEVAYRFACALVLFVCAVAFAAAG